VPLHLVENSGMATKVNCVGERKKVNGVNGAEKPTSNIFTGASNSGTQKDSPREAGGGGKEKPVKLRELDGVQERNVKGGGV